MTNLNPKDLGKAGVLTYKPRKTKALHREWLCTVTLHTRWPMLQPVCLMPPRENGEHVHTSVSLVIAPQGPDAAQCPLGRWQAWQANTCQVLLWAEWSR